MHAPNLAGIYGRPVQLEGGRSIVADDAYIRDSMLQPTRDIVAGYEPLMPSFAGVLSDGEIQALTAYIRSLATEDLSDTRIQHTEHEELVPDSPAERSPSMMPGRSLDRSGGSR